MKTAEQIADAVRAGTLTALRVEVAAYCGSAAARAALDKLEVATKFPAFLSDEEFKQALIDAELHLPDWAEPLSEHADAETCARAAYAAAHATVESEASDGQAEPREVLEAIREHLTGPSPGTREALEKLQASYDDTEWEEHGLGDHGIRSLGCALACALGDKSQVIEAVDASGVADGYEDDDDAETDVDARRVVTEALVPWLLGDGDPLKS